MASRAHRLALSVLVMCVAPLAGSAAGDPPKRYDGYKIVRADIRDQADLTALEQAGVEILNCVPGIGSMDLLVSPGQLAIVERLGPAAQVAQNDVQGWLDRRRAAVVAGTGDPFADFFLAYHDYDGFGGIVWYMNELVTRYPTLASMVNVGTTLEGRTIWGIRVTNHDGLEKPGVVYFGCEHAREWITTTVPTYLATQLLEGYDADPVISDLIDNVEFLLIPVLNVDGYEYTRTTDRFWRKNRRHNGGTIYGVDLNRNWAEGWGGPGSSSTSGSSTYRGPSPFSEPETQALRDFLVAHPNVRAQLDIHSYSQLILWPFGYTEELSADHDLYQQLGLAMQSLIRGVHGRMYDIGPVYTGIYPASGISIDWTYAELDILSLTFECRDTGYYGFDLPAVQIIPNNEELLPAILHLTNSDRIRAAMRFRFPEGLPTMITAGADTTMTVEVLPLNEPVDEDSATLHYRYDPTGPFVASQMDPLGGDAYATTLPATNCASTPEYYFSVESVTGSRLSDPPDAPAGEVYSARVTAGDGTFWREDLSDDPAWTSEGGWEWGQPAGLGGSTGSPDPSAGYSGDHVYGYNLLGDYWTNLPEHDLTSLPIDCSGRFDVRLAFRRWLGVERPTWDHAYVRVSANGTDWVTVWENEDEVDDGDWTLQELDISDLADDQAAVYLRWTMGTTDAYAHYCGWNLDDISLTSTVCEALANDHNGDGVVDQTDLDALDGCFSGSGAPFGPGCALFDTDADGDVDCDDWVTFHGSWTGPGQAPSSFESCEDRAAPTVAPAGARYIAISPAPGLEPVAIELSSPQLPCLGAYVDFDPDPALAAAGVGRLYDVPVFRTPLDWGTLHLTDAGIVPAREYVVGTVSGQGIRSAKGMVTTMRWGDVIDAMNAVNVLDIAAVVDHVKLVPSAQPLERCDLSPAVPDHVVDVLDVAAAVEAVKGFEFLLDPSTECSKR